VQAGAVLALAAVVLAVSGAPKTDLTVRITGSGTVSSSPAGISCKPKCTMTARKGAKVTLTASPTGNAEFSHWSAPCGEDYTCTVKLTTSRTMRAFFKTAPPAPPAPPLPPPPAPPAKPGHYVGTYSDGTLFDFDVVGSVVTNLTFDYNGHCADGGTIAGPTLKINGTFPIGSNGSWSGPITLTFSDASGSATAGGTLTTGGTGTGTLSVSLTFNDGTSCQSTGTWTAQEQG
jgi:hypothetical protein